MNGRLGDSDAFRVEDFYPQALEAFRWQGEQLCLPQNVSSLVVYYNRTLFQRRNVPEPAEDWTWSQLVAAAAELTLDEAGNRIRGGDPDAGGAKAAIYGLGIEPTLIRLAPLVWSNGGELVDDPPTRLTLGTPEGLGALRELFALRQPFGVVPSDVEIEAEEDESRFANGRLAMLLASRRSTPTFARSRTSTGMLPLFPRFASAWASFIPPPSAWPQRRIVRTLRGGS